MDKIPQPIPTPDETVLGLRIANAIAAAVGPRVPICDGCGRPWIAENVCDWNEHPEPNGGAK